MLVKNIKFKNNKVEVVLDDTSFFISKENYIENPVAINSFIDKDRIDLLLMEEKNIECKNYIIKQLNKKVMSEYDVYKKLEEKDLKKESIEKIVDSLKRMGLINDEYFASLFADVLLTKKRGKLDIYSCLREKRIDEEIIRRVINEIDFEQYNSNFKRVCEKYMKIYSNRSYIYKEKMVKIKLKEYGYEDELIGELYIEKNNDEEYELAKKTLMRLLTKNNKDLSKYENLNKIRVKLVNKGFNYDIINLVIEEVVKNEIH